MIKKSQDRGFTPIRLKSHKFSVDHGNHLTTITLSRDLFFLRSYILFQCSSELQQITVTMVSKLLKPQSIVHRFKSNRSSRGIARKAAPKLGGAVV